MGIRDASRLPGREIVAIVAVSAVAMVVALLTDETAPILAFSGALIVAFVTLVSSDRRQERALAAELCRQGQQLAHAREMADLGDLRHLLDEAASALYRAADVRRDFTSVKYIVDATPAETKQFLPDAGDHLSACSDALDAMAARLTVRLGGAHDIPKALLHARANLTLMSASLMMLKMGEPADRHVRAKTGDPADAHGSRSTLCSRIQEAGEAFDSDRQEFQSEATALAGSRVGNA